MKISILTAILVLITGYGSVCLGDSPQGPYITIFNNTSNPVWIYDFDFGATPLVATQPVTGGNPLGQSATLNLPMQSPSNPNGAGRRIYFADKELTDSLEGKGQTSQVAPPDSFCPWYDGATMYSYAEYNYMTSGTYPNTYTIDLSYIGTFSFPITIKFSGGTKASDYVENFEYGFTSLATVTQALKTQASSNKDGTKSYPWKSLVWPLTNATPINPTLHPWPDNIYRVIGPLNLWASQSYGALSGYAPATYQNFINYYPYNGFQLFDTTTTNLNGWNNCITRPSSTGYVQALHSASSQDKHDKYGFFCYPNDEAQGQFTYVSVAEQCTLTIYPYNQ